MGHRQLEVVGRELQLAVACREQDVAQDRQHALGRHDPTDDGKALGEVLLQALELHFCLFNIPSMRSAADMVPNAEPRGAHFRRTFSAPTPANPALHSKRTTSW